MISPSFPRPSHFWAALGLAAWLPLAGALSAPAQAAQEQPATIGLCIKQTKPRKGSVRFKRADTPCGKGERWVVLVTSSGGAGAPGSSGESGAQPGPPGPVGAQGAQGEKGERGEQGPPGIQGPQGLQGPPGIQGPQGIQGIQGDRGEAGEPGIQGEQGEQGVQGPAGEDGEDGRAVLSGEGSPGAGVGNAGDFYIDLETHDVYGSKQGEEWGPGTSLVGPQGEQGPEGEQGPAGPAGSGLWAVVANNGSLARGSGVVATSGAPGSTSSIEFSQAVGGCAYLSAAAETGTTSPGSEPLGFTLATGHPSNDRVVRVRTYDKGGSPADRPFHLTVVC